MEPLAVEYGVTLEVKTTEPISVSGDEARLMQVVMNLLENAIRYTNAGGHVFVTVLAKDTQACLVVRDTGIGIAPEHQPYFFDRFYQVDAARKNAEMGNSGLGLAIVDLDCQGPWWIDPGRESGRTGLDFYGLAPLVRDRVRSSDSVAEAK